MPSAMVFPRITRPFENLCIILHHILLFILHIIFFIDLKYAIRSVHIDKIHPMGHIRYKNVRFGQRGNIRYTRTNRIALLLLREFQYKKAPRSNHFLGYRLKTAQPSKSGVILRRALPDEGSSHRNSAKQHRKCEDSYSVLRTLKRLRAKSSLVDFTS